MSSSVSSSSSRGATNERLAPVDSLNAKGNEKVKHPTKLGLKKGVSGEEKIYRLNDTNPFFARLIDGQLIWSAPKSVDYLNVADVIAFSINNKRAIHINTGTHGDKKGMNIGDPASPLHYAEASFSIQDFETAKKLNNVSLHIVSKHRPALTHEEIPNMDIVQAWCYSAHSDASREPTSSESSFFDVMYAMTKVLAASQERQQQDKSPPHRQVNMNGKRSHYVESAGSVTIDNSKRVKKEVKAHNIKGNVKL